MRVEVRQFWQLLEDATWVMWDQGMQHCLVWVAGEGYRLYRYGRKWVRVVAEGQEAERIGRTLGVGNAA